MLYIKRVLYSTIVGLCLCTNLLAQTYMRGKDLYYKNPDVSSCFINRWSFQELADHVYDPRTGKFDQPTTRKEGGVTFDPASVNPGDIIFVRRIDLFMQKMHPKIKVPYIMLSHGDFLDLVQEESLRYLDDEKIIAWFAIHPPKHWHPKFFPIPLGISQKREIFDRQRHYIRLFERMREVKKTRLLSGLFSTYANPEREALKNSFAHKSYYYPSYKAIPFDRYLEELAASAFTLSPRGWGPDCYRTWEALFVGTIPVVKRGQYGGTEYSKKILRTMSPSQRAVHAQLDKLYEDLPILVIDDWDEINKEFLEKKYKEITSRKYNLEPLFIDYWRSVMMAVKDEYLRNYTR